MPNSPMNHSALKELHDRRCDVIGRRPSLARHTGMACVHLTDGFVCDVHHQDRMLRVDQPETEGGTGDGPNPDQLMLASLGASLAMGYRLWAAARCGPRIDSVDIEITSQADLRGQMGLSGDVAVGWQEILVHVAIVSPASAAAVRQLVEHADHLNPMLANLAPSIVRSHRLTVIAPGPGGPTGDRS